MNTTKETFVFGFAIFAAFFGAGKFNFTSSVGVQCGPRLVARRIRVCYFCNHNTIIGPFRTR